MNPFANWTPQQIAAHNQRVRMKAGKPLTTLVGTYEKRIRQDEPTIRPWEQEWKSQLENSGAWENVKAQAIRVRLANGAWYKGDVSATLKGSRTLHIFEIKGGKKMKGVAKGILALKVAASQYREIVWTLCFKENGEWRTQTVLP